MLLQIAKLKVTPTIFADSHNLLRNFTGIETFLSILSKSPKRICESRVLHDLARSRGTTPIWGILILL